MFGKINADENQALEIMVNFAEGKITASDFWEALSSQNLIYSLMVNDVYRSDWQKKYDYPKYFFARYDGDKLFDRTELHNVVTMYLKQRKILFTSFSKDVKMCVFLIQVFPSWLDVQDEKLLIEVFNSAPEELSKIKKKKYCKDRIKELFRYDNKPPKWIQNPEWPIINGKPLVFCKQEDDNNDNSRVLYYFYDPETYAETVIEQFD